MALAAGGNRAQEAVLMSIWPSAVSLKPPPEQRASTSGWISAPIAVSAGERP
jgi:hypothetical protein